MCLMKNDFILQYLNKILLHFKLDFKKTANSNMERKRKVTKEKIKSYNLKKITNKEKRQQENGAPIYKTSPE